MSDNVKLSNDDLWRRAGEGGGVSRAELGIDDSSSTNEGITTITEGVQNMSFGLEKNNSNEN